MCGLAGHLAFPRGDLACARRMANALAHRGPDGSGEAQLGPLALAHRRLSIIDLQGGAQPMRQRALTIAFNGEIYNYRELRDELQQAGRSFRTASDTEVLLQLYEVAGEAMLPRLRGMFAFALWDERQGALLLARDAFGEKPLVYCEERGQLWFASEIQALQAGGAPVGQLDRQALSDYLELLYVPAPGAIWTQVRKLPAGHLLRADARGTAVRRWYEPPEPGAGVGAARKTAPSRLAVRALLEESVRLQLRSDVPVGALLSGGLDSSAVVALMTRAAGKVRTFSVGFGEADDELPEARKIAHRFRTDHQEILLSGKAAEDAQPAIASCGEPFGDSSIVPTWAVFRAVARECKVVLTGDGGDELFAGYGRYLRARRLPHSLRAARAAELLRQVVPGSQRARLGRAARTLGSSGAARARALSEVFSLEERQLLLHATARTARGASYEPEDDVDAALAFDLEVYLPDDLLYKVDTAAMRFSVESRAPLLDVRLAAAVIPPASRHKLGAVRGKRLLRAAVSDLLPFSTLTREKRGFGSPIASWLRGPLRAMFSDLVRPPSARIRTFFDPRGVDRILELSLGPRGNPHQAWALFALEIWARAHG